MATWSLLWIGAITIRLLVTPIALLSVYFATLLPGAPVLLGGVAAYLAMLAAETVVLVRSVLHPSLRPSVGSAALSPPVRRRS
jgi:hypothetical protein